MSQFGFIICDFDGSSGANTIDTGYTITFTKAKRGNGRKYGLVNTQYEGCLTTTFHIAKNPDDCSDQEISNDEYRNIVRWLNRHRFLPFRVIYEYDRDNEPCYFNASFNIRKIIIAERLYGLELTVETDSPYGYGVPFKKTFQLGGNFEARFIDYSDDSGFFVPDMKITCGASGNLTITNLLTDTSMSLKNCTEGEVITIRGDTQIITSSISSHQIYNDFNYEFLQIGNSYNNRENVLTATLACTIELSYRPMIKDIP